MLPYSRDSKISEAILKGHQLATLRSLSELLIQEVISLEQMQRSLENEINRGKPICLSKELERFEANLLRCALIRSMGNQTKAAALLGLGLTTIHSKIKRYKIDPTKMA